MTWLPISEAPRDREVLLYFAPVAKRNNELPSMMRVGFVGAYPNRPPIAWQPLPPPPESEK